MTPTELIALISITLIGLFSRLFRIKKRSLLFWDDGDRLKESLFFGDLLKFIRTHLRELLANKIKLDRDVTDKFSGRPMCGGYPGFTFLYSLGGKIFGRNDEGALILNGLLGVGSGLAVFCIGRELFNTQAGLLGFFVLMFSGYHLMYTRSIAAESTCGFFYIWGSYFFLMSVKSNFAYLYLILAGFFGGMAFLCNSRQFYLPAFFMFFETAFFLARPSIDGISRLLVMGMSIAFPIILAQEFYMVLKEMGYREESYFKQLFMFAGNVSGLDFRLPNLFSVYLKTFLHADALSLPILALIGSVDAAKMSGQNSVDYFRLGIVLFQAWFPLIFWSARPRLSEEEKMKRYNPRIHGWNQATPRLLSTALGAFAVLSGFGLFFVPEPYRWIVAAGIALYGIWIMIKMIKIESGYKKAVDFIRSQDSGQWKHFSMVFPISSFLVGNDSAYDIRLPENNLERIRSLYEKGFRYLICTTFNFNFGPLPEGHGLHTILEKLKPVFIVEPGMGDFVPFELDYLEATELVEKPMVRVYDLKQFFQTNNPKSS